MKIEKTSSGSRKITMSKAEWINIGKQAGWTKTAERWERSDSDSLTLFLDRNIATNECTATFKWPENEWGKAGEDGYIISSEVFDRAKESPFHNGLNSDGVKEQLIFDEVGTVNYSVEGATVHIGWNDPDESEWKVNRYLGDVSKDIRELLGEAIIQGLKLELDETTHDAS